MTLAELLEKIEEKHPNFEAVSNLMAHLSLGNMSPDTLIDLAHSLNEATAKNLRYLVDKSLSVGKIEKQVNTEKHWNALRPKLANDDLSEEFFEALHCLFDSVRQMRNRHGDITHGHLGPKKYTDEKTARFLFDISLAHARYVLVVADMIDSEQISYDKYEDFNAELDLQGESIGQIPYSKLVYDHDYNRYIDELERFNPDVYKE